MMEIYRAINEVKAGWADEVISPNWIIRRENGEVAICDVEDSDKAGM